MQTWDYDNLITLFDKRIEHIADVLKAHGVVRGHFTNGVYSAPAEKIVPTVMAGFQFVTDQMKGDDTAIIVAVNSEHSYAELTRQRIAKGSLPPAALDNLENQMYRAAKMDEPLALQFPNRKVFTFFYDEDTPRELYQGLFEKDFGMESIFKWGYGLEGTGIIEGAKFFKRVFAFPLPSDPPFAHDITRMTGQEKDAEIFELRTATAERPDGKGYISDDGKALFRLHHEDLLQYAARGTGGLPNTWVLPKPK